MGRFLLRLLNLFPSRRGDDELAREVASHLALLEEEHIRRGMAPEQARLAARRAMGSITLTKHLHRDARSFVWLEDLRIDADIRAATVRTGRCASWRLIERGASASDSISTGAGRR